MGVLRSEVWRKRVAEMAKVITVNLLNGKLNDQLEKSILEYFICNVQHQEAKFGVFFIFISDEERFLGRGRGTKPKYPNKVLIDYKISET